MIERDVEQYLVEQVEERGGLCLKLAEEGKRGWPDRTILWPETRANGWSGPYVEFVEVKRPGGGKLSRQQKLRLDLLETMGFGAHVVSSKDEVDAFLEGY